MWGAIRTASETGACECACSPLSLFTVERGWSSNGAGHQLRLAIDCSWPSITVSHQVGLVIERGWLCALSTDRG